MKSVDMARAKSPAITNRSEFVRVSKSRLLDRSTMRPIGIAKRSHGSITSALSIEIRTGFFVSEIASRGTATANKPSARLLMALAPNSRLNPGPNLSVFNLRAYWVPTAGDHILGFIWTPSPFKVWVYTLRGF